VCRKGELLVTELNIAIEDRLLGLCERKSNTVRRKPWSCFSVLSTLALHVLYNFLIFSFFNRRYNPAQISLSILSRNVLQSAVASSTSNPQLGGPVIRTFQLSPRRERTPAAEGGTMGEKFPRILPKVATSTSLLGSFTCSKFTTLDRRIYFPSEGRRAEDFFARKIRRLRPGLNPRIWVPKAGTLISRPPKPLTIFWCEWKNNFCFYLRRKFVVVTGAYEFLS